MREEIDFSSIPRLTPRADSFEQVLSRLDRTRNVVRFKVFSAVAVAASIALVCASVMLSAFSSAAGNSEILSIDGVANSELASWFNSLGEGNTDNYEILDQSSTVSYLTWEGK